MTNETQKADEQALEQMRRIGHSTTRWAAYQNVALDSAGLGHLQFLAVGPDNTYQEPPKQYPADTSSGMGWRYRFCGWVDMETGIVEEPL